MDNIAVYNDIPAIMTVPQLGVFLGVGRNSAYQLVRSGRIESIRIGKQIRITKHAVLNFIGGLKQ